jgi:hypothetical protein
MDTNTQFLRVGAVAAVSGALAQVVATVLEPDRGDDTVEAIRIVARSEVWTIGRLLDLIGVLLTVGALTVVGRTFPAGPGRDWARAGQPFLVLMGALGAGAVVTGATLRDAADAWVAAAPEAKASYLAVFDTTTVVTDNLFFGAFLAMGMYLAALATAILKGRTYARWIGAAAAVGAGLVLAGDLFMLAADAAFIAVLAGFALFMTVLIAIGVSLWRHTAAPRPVPVSPPGVTAA